ncbi:MAG: hypothetical protein V2I26_20470 [Halieaceae bacterium]|jgi:hypothetical protein|nr:hypothetical protein [Halieaceae bacterium]
MAVNHRHIAHILGDAQPAADTSLRAQSLARATSADVPRTLTPFEWEQWYEQHGVPEEHQQRPRTTAPSWWRRFFRKA